MKYEKPIVIMPGARIDGSGNYIGSYMQGVFLWNAYARGVLTEAQYEATAACSDVELARAAVAHATGQIRLPAAPGADGEAGIVERK